MLHRRLFFLLAAVVLFGAGCDEKPQGRRYVVFLDRSASVSPQQRNLWCGSVEKLLKNLGAGDAVVIFPLSSLTASAAPLFEGQIPAINAAEGIEPARRLQAAIQGVREGAVAAIRQASETPGGSPTTDVFSAISRIKPDSRPLIAVFLSDLVHTESAKGPNLRKADLLPENMPDIIQAVAKQQQWTTGALDQVQVYCLLDDSEVISRRALELFWRTTFESLGATLKHFDNTQPADWLAD